MSDNTGVQRVIRVFIASPGDVQDERNIVITVVEEINKIISRRLNIYIELLGWEDTIPGAGRPQAIINKDVIASELFIGLLYRRWGTPSGEFSSGFEEEFRLAFELYEKKGIKEIWLAFKSIEDDYLRDPGEQLKKVIEFKKDRISKRDVLFKEFKNSEEWRANIYGWLLDYVLQQSETAIKIDENFSNPSVNEIVLIEDKQNDQIDMSAIPNVKDFIFNNDLSPYDLSRNLI